MFFFCFAFKELSCQPKQVNTKTIPFFLSFASKIGIFIPSFPHLGYSTVYFFSFEILYDGITQKVFEIIEFQKKFLKDIGRAFYNM